MPRRKRWCCSAGHCRRALGCPALPFFIKGTGYGDSDVQAYFEITWYILSQDPPNTARSQGTEGIAPPHGEFPRGFPLMMASLRLAGMSEVHAGRTIEVVSTIIFIASLVGILLELFPAVEALLIAVSVVSMRSFVFYSTICMSEVPYWAQATLSAYLLLKWNRGGCRSWGWLGLAGLVAATSSGVRYVGLSLMAAEALFLLMFLFWTPLRSVLRNLCVWAVGVMIGVSPFLVLNLMEFGRVIPYGDFMPLGSKVSLWLNVQLLCFITLREFTTCESSTVLRWLLSVLVAAAVLLVLLKPPSKLLRRGTGIRAFLADHRSAILLVAYLTLYIVMLVASQMKHRNPEPIDQRYLMPIFWIIWIGLVGTALRGMIHLGFRPGTARTVTIVLLIAAIAMQAWFTVAAQTRPWLAAKWW